MELVNILLMAPSGASSGGGGSSAVSTIIMMVIIVGLIVFFVVRAVKKNRKLAEQNLQNLEKTKNELREKMVTVSDDVLIHILDNFKDYEIEPYKAALAEAKKRKIKYDFDKVDIKLEFSKAPEKTIVVNQTTKKSNGIATAGFILALIAVCLSWIPIVQMLGGVLWFLGLLFSFIGVFKAPRGLAIAGLIISLIALIILISVFGALLGIGSMSH